MDVLHENEYDLTKTICGLVGKGGPTICRDEMEEWSSSEANLFEEALEKYGKDFVDIRQDFLPWKSLKSVIEYYYMWKTTDRYVQQVLLCHVVSLSLVSGFSCSHNNLKTLSSKNFNNYNMANRSDSTRIEIALRLY